MGDQANEVMTESGFDAEHLSNRVWQGSFERDA
jgi:hypothetical protein